MVKFIGIGNSQKYKKIKVSSMSDMIIDNLKMFITLDFRSKLMYKIVSKNSKYEKLEFAEFLDKNFEYKSIEFTNKWIFLQKSMLMLASLLYLVI